MEFSDVDDQPGRGYIVREVHVKRDRVMDWIQIVIGDLNNKELITMKERGCESGEVMPVLKCKPGQYIAAVELEVLFTDRTDRKSSFVGGMRLKTNDGEEHYICPAPRDAIYFEFSHTEWLSSEGRPLAGFHGKYYPFIYSLGCYWSCLDHK